MDRVVILVRHRIVELLHSQKLKQEMLQNIYTKTAAIYWVTLVCTVIVSSG